MIAKEYADAEFGRVTIKRLSSAKYVRVRVTPSGQLRATMPKFAPTLLLKNLIDRSRNELRQAIADLSSAGPPIYHDGMQVGASHRIVIHQGTRSSARRHDLLIHWTLPAGADYRDPANQMVVQKAVRKALDIEAKAYLPRRLDYLARQGNFVYEAVRYGNAKGRWGSCSNRGIIRLNVALMNLPKPLIDYVMVHELAHTQQLNHSTDFWQIVAEHYPDYKNARKLLKNYSPYL